jgi:hypothetical protein
MVRSLPVAIAVGLVGAIFTLQGIGLLGGSAMTGSAFWAVIGVLLLALAVFLAWQTRRPTPRA